MRGDVLEVYPAYSGGDAYRIEFFGDEVDRITEIDTLTGEIKAQLGHIAIFPASHYVIPKERMEICYNSCIRQTAERILDSSALNPAMPTRRRSLMDKKKLHIRV